MTLAVVPVKALADSKSRLLPELDRDQLEALSLAMLSDVISALLGTPSIPRVVVLTPDAAVAGTARSLGAEALERPDSGLNPAVNAAARDLIGDARTPYLVMLGDVAGARSQEIEELLHSADPSARPHVSLAPTSDGGTAALLRNPHDAIPSCFGRDSARRHREAATGEGVAFREVALPSLSLDLDRAADLDQFARASHEGSHTRKLLHELGWGEDRDA